MNARFVVALSLTTFSLFGSACEKTKKEGEKPTTAGIPQELVLSTISDPKTFNPVVSNENSSNTIINWLHESLVQRNPKTLEIEPRLAESWTTSEDGLTWVFTLREGLKFSDGAALTSADVVFTLDTVYDENVHNPTRDILSVDGKPFGYKALDPRRIEITLPAPYAPFLDSIGISILPKHKLAKALADKTFTEAWNIQTPPQELVGAGPYIMQKYVPAQYVTYKRNPNYWRKGPEGEALPKIEKLSLLIVANLEVQYAKFTAGETDLYSPMTDKVPALQEGAAKGGFTVKKVGTDLGTGSFVMFNQNPAGFTTPENSYKFKWFSSKAFRQAFSHAIDRKTIANNVFLGLAEPAASYTSPEVKPYYNTALAAYDYDLDKARKLLTDAGFVYKKNGEADELYDAEGNRVALDLITNGDTNPLRAKVASIIQADWTKLGVKVNYRPVEFNTLVTKLQSDFSWEACIIGLGGGGLEPHNGANVHKSSGFTHMWYPNQSTPATAWEAELDELVEKGVRDMDMSTRPSHYKRIQEIYHEQQPLILTVRQQDFAAFRNNVKNYDPGVLGADMDLVYIGEAKP